MKVRLSIELSFLQNLIIMAKNKPIGDNARKGAVRNRSQVFNPKTKLFVKRGPYVQWCERCTLSLLRGRAAYSITHRSFLYLFKQTIFYQI